MDSILATRCPDEYDCFPRKYYAHEMEPANATVEYGFVVSTPSYNASQQDEVRTFVRTHVMRRLSKKKRHGRAVQLQGKDLQEYLSYRQLRQKLDTSIEATRFITGAPLNDAVVLGSARLNPFATYPIQMQVKDHELVHHIWASHQVTFQPFRQYWFSLGMVDPAAMHLVLSNAATHLNCLLNSRDQDMTILAHNTAALRSVNERIGNPSQNTTDEIVGAVLGHLASKYERCEIHLAGLGRILQLRRGGPASIESNKWIRLTLFWIEHNMATDQDTIPLYPPPFHLIKCPYSKFERSQGLLHRNMAISFGEMSSLFSSEMLDILTDLSVLMVTLKVQSTERNIWEDPDFPGFGVNPILSKLLTIQAMPEEDTFRRNAREICRLGSILFLAEIRRKLGVSPIVTKVQVTKLRLLVETNTTIWDKSLERIFMWALVMAGCAASTEEERIWVVQALVQSGIFTTCIQWDGLISMVSEMWWIDEVFSAAVEKLQNEFTRVERSGNAPQF